MSKEVKGNAGRKPPEPSIDHSDIDEWLRRQMPHLQPIVEKLDESIRAAIPGLQYAVKWKRPYYGLPELGWIIELAAYDGSGVTYRPLWGVIPDGVEVSCRDHGPAAAASRGGDAAP